MLIFPCDLRLNFTIIVKEIFGHRRSSYLIDTFSLGSNGIFTHHRKGTGNTNGTLLGSGSMDFNICRNVHTGPRQVEDQDPLFLIVRVPFLVPPPVPVPRIVSKPQYPSCFVQGLTLHSPFTPAFPYVWYE